LQFSFQAASPETFGYTLVYSYFTEKWLQHEQRLPSRVVRFKQREEQGKPEQAVDLCIIKKMMNPD
jgi:hypothetical protein